MYPGLQDGINLWGLRWGAAVDAGKYNDALGARSSHELNIGGAGAPTSIHRVTKSTKVSPRKQNKANLFSRPDFTRMYSFVHKKNEQKTCGKTYISYASRNQERVFPMPQKKQHRHTGTEAAPRKQRDANTRALLLVLPCPVREIRPPPPAGRGPCRAGPLQGGRGGATNSPDLDLREGNVSRCRQHLRVL